MTYAEVAFPCTGLVTSGGQMMKGVGTAEVEKEDPTPSGEQAGASSPRFFQYLPLVHLVNSGPSDRTKPGSQANLQLVPAGLGPWPQEGGWTRPLAIAGMGGQVGPEEEGGREEEETHSASVPAHLESVPHFFLMCPEGLNPLLHLSLHLVPTGYLPPAASLRRLHLMIPFLGLRGDGQEALSLSLSTSLQVRPSLRSRCEGGQVHSCDPGVFLQPWEQPPLSEPEHSSTSSQRVKPTSLELKKY